ncbi:MAG: ABC transporter permease [Anaerolineales bacterium]|nr:ABC transporter permease [Anaerolineales bacterium]
MDSENRSKPAPSNANNWFRFLRLPSTSAVYTLLGSPKARFGFVIVMTFILAAVFAPLVAPGDPKEYVGIQNQAPSGEFLLGTNPQGKDVLRQLVWGSRLSLLIGFGSGSLMVSIATVIGMIAGYYRGIVDDILNFIMNLFLVIPGLPLLVLLSAYLKPGTTTIIFALAFTGWAYNARIIRAQTMSLREKDFVAAAALSGESTLYVIFVHILPNMVNIIVGGFIGAVIYGIMASTGLAFLGLASTQDVTWGTNLFWAQNGGALMIGAWWAFVPSGLAVALVAFGLALINYGMDEITNPRLSAEGKIRSVLKKARIPLMRATPVVPYEED